MILHHVAHGSRFVVVTGTSFNAERFHGSDLDMADVAGIPE